MKQGKYFKNLLSFETKKQLDFCLYARKGICSSLIMLNSNGKTGEDPARSRRTVCGARLVKSSQLVNTWHLTRDAAVISKSNMTDYLWTAKLRYVPSKIAASVGITSSNPAQGGKGRTREPGDNRRRRCGLWAAPWGTGAGRQRWGSWRRWRPARAVCFREDGNRSADRVKATPTTAVVKGTTKRRLPGGAAPRARRLRPRLRRDARRSGGAAGRGVAAQAELPRGPPWVRPRSAASARAPCQRGPAGAPRPAHRTGGRSSQWRSDRWSHRPALPASVAAVPANGRWGGVGEARVRGGIRRPWVERGGGLGVGSSVHVWRVRVRPPAFPRCEGGRPSPLRGRAGGGVGASSAPSRRLPQRRGLRSVRLWAGGGPLPAGRPSVPRAWGGAEVSRPLRRGRAAEARGGRGVPSSAGAARSLPPVGWTLLSAAAGEAAGTRFAGPRLAAGEARGLPTHSSGRLKQANARGNGKKGPS